VSPFKNKDLKMSLKSVLASLEGIPEAIQAQYKEHDGKFHLDIDGIDDHHGVGALKRAKDYEKENARKAKDESLRLTSELEVARSEIDDLKKSGIPKGDVERLEQSYKDRHAKSDASYQDKIKSLTSSLERLLLDGQAMSMANEVAAKTEYVEILLPHIRSRLKMEAGEGDTHVVRIVDRDGKPSASTIEDLKKELLGNKAFAAILTGSKAAGGGAGGGSGNGGGAPKKLNEMNDAERTKFAKDDPQGFRSALSEAQKASASSF